NIEIKGNWKNEAVFIEGTGQITFSGTSDQEIRNGSGETFYNLLINKSGGSITLNDNVMVTSTLTMTDGKIVASAGTLTLGSSLLNEGTLIYTSGLIDGNFKRWVNSSGNFLFPVGANDSCQVLEVTLGTFSSGGTLSASFNSSPPGNEGLPLDDGSETIYNTFNEGFWILTDEDGFSLGVGNIYNLLLDGSGFTSFSILADTRVLTRSASFENWETSGTHDAAVGSVAKRTGISILQAEYALGDTTDCIGPVTSSISGTNEVCSSATGISYSVTDNPPNTYNWTISGGTIASGDGTNSITVDWGDVGTENGNVRVVETNNCTSGEAVDFPVIVHSVAPSEIIGSTSIAEYSNGVSYSVTGIADYIYNWTISGGTLASGDETSSITVDWGSVGTGTVGVVAQKPGCDAAFSVQIEVDKYIIIESIATGDWSATSTWDCGCIPLSTDDVRINFGHTVTLSDGGGTEIGNLIISTGGQINSNNTAFTIHGDLTVNGTYIGGTKALTLDGAIRDIDGTGTITEGMNLSTGHKCISSFANLTISSGDISLGNGAIVHNQGSITIIDNITGGDALTKWINDVDASLNIGGSLMATGILDASATGNTISYDGIIAQTIKTPQSSYYNLSAEGSDTKSLVSNLDVDGNITISGTAVLDVTAANNYSINLGGNWNNSGGTFDEQLGSVIFDGSDNDTISGAETFYNLTVAKSGGALILNNDIIVSNSLSMESGNIDTQVNKLTLGTSTANIGTLNFTSGTIIGKYEKWFDAGSTGSGKVFPIGTVDFYRPATLTFNAITGGSLISEFIASDPLIRNLPITESNGYSVTDQYLEGYWDFTAANSFASTNYNLHLAATEFTTYTIDPETRIIKSTDGINWHFDGTHSAASSPDCYRNGLTGGISTSQFAIGFAPNTWTGNTDSDWHDAANWAGSIPISTEDVFIPSSGITNYPVITSSADCKNIEIDESASLTLTSDAGTVASLIVSGSSVGNATYESYITAQQWHILSTPLEGQSIDDFLANSANNIPTRNSIYAITDYDENPGSWNAFFAATGNGIFDTGKGYLVGRSSPDGTVSFTGTIADETVTVPVTSTDRGWNCIGNPFTSAIGANDLASSTSDFLAVNSGLLDASHTALYLWDEQAGYNGTQNNYKVIGNSGYEDPELLPGVGNDYIQAGQGFLIKAASSGNISFTEAMQYHDVGSQLLKSKNTSWDGFKLIAQKDEDIRYCIIAFNENMTRGLDPSYDAGILKTAGKFAIYTRLAEDDYDVDFEIQCLPESNSDEIIVPVGLDIPEDGLVKFSLGGIILDKKKSVVLEDRELNNFVSLKTEEDFYETNLSVNNTGPGRFFLHLGNNGDDDSANKEKKQNKYKAYWDGSQIVLKSKSPSSSKINLIDMNGWVLSEYSLHQILETSLKVPNKSKGIYYLRIFEENEVTILKVHIF
ncbi:MAG: hypothetical protein KAS71_05870, partial [Bacteroidales bacterium]|nr:hypothetical protein [Bacteroidales bacterium]